MAIEIERNCAERLRELRKERGLTLDEFSRLSGGRIKSVVLGSYERGDRAISLERLALLAELYQVPVQYFFEPLQIGAREVDGRWVIDLRKLGMSSPSDSFAQTLIAYLNTLIRKRRDFNGEVLTIRVSDRENMTFIYHADQYEIKEGLTLRGLLYGVNELSNP